MVNIINKTELDISFLEKMSEWVRGQLKLPKYYTKEIKFKYLPKNSSTWYSGVSFNSERRVLISLPREGEYPCEETRFWRFHLEYHDLYDILVTILSHELRHQYQDYKTIISNIEFDAVRYSFEVLKTFKEDKEELLEEWLPKPKVLPAIGSKDWYGKTLLDLMNIHISKGGNTKMTVGELIKHYQSLTILR